MHVRYTMAIWIPQHISIYSSYKKWWNLSNLGSFSVGVRSHASITIQNIEQCRCSRMLLFHAPNSNTEEINYIQVPTARTFSARKTNISTFRCNSNQHSRGTLYGMFAIKMLCLILYFNINRPLSFLLFCSSFFILLLFYF